MKAGGQDLDFSKTVFLVVDDKPFYRDMAHQAVMRGKARDVKHAASLETAIQLLNRLGQGIDCVIVDWDIAPEGGLELLRKIRTKSLPKTPARTPVVILTGKPDPAAVIAAKKLDVNGFAVAPLSLEKLAKTIGNAIARTWTLQESGVYAAVPGVLPSLVTRAINHTGVQILSAPVSMTAQTTISKPAMARIRRGERIARMAIRCSTTAILPLDQLTYDLLQCGWRDADRSTCGRRGYPAVRIATIFRTVTQ